MSLDLEADTDNNRGGLNIADSLRQHYVFPCGGFITLPDSNWVYLVAQYNQKDKKLLGEDIKNDSSGHCWLVENLRFGTTWTAIPTFIPDLCPSQIHLSIPDQTEWPPSSWSRLEARDSVHMHGSRSRSLGIAAHLRQGLAHWSTNLEGFEKMYVDLPLGSVIRLREMKENPTDLEFDVIPNKSGANPKIFLSATELRGLWKREESDMPPSIPYRSLRLVRYLESDVMLVSLTGDDGKTEIFAFKTRKKPPSVYHELKILLEVPSLETIISRPRYLVTFTSGSGQPLVCGFLTTFLEGGSLDSRLPELRRSGLLTKQRQLSLAKDVTSTLIHIKKSPVSFYSDLRLDQIILSKNKAGEERAVILDFEQSRNLYNWTAPEIYYMEWIAELGWPDYFRSDAIPEEVTEKYADLLHRYREGRKQPLPAPTGRYDNPALGWYWPWLVSNAQERESAMVYMLGKLLWCIFEGRGDADIVLGRSSPEEAEQRFPDFVRTHPQMRLLITRCTAGAREWIDGPIKIYRRNGVIYPLGMTGLQGEREGTARETETAIRDFWRGEMGKAEAFAEARIRWDRGERNEGDRQHLHYLDRPRLHEVLAELEAFGSKRESGWSCCIL